MKTVEWIMAMFFGAVIYHIGWLVGWRARGREDKL